MNIVLTRRLPQSWKKWLDVSHFGKPVSWIRNAAEKY